MQWLVFGLALLNPVLLIGLIGSISLFQRAPLATGIGRGLRGIAIPTAAVLFLFYGLSLWPTANTEAAIGTAVAKIMYNQPHFLAEGAHNTGG